MKKNHLKIIITIILAILVISTSMMIYLSNLLAVSFSIGFYEEKFDKYDIYSRFSEDTDIINETQYLLDYIESGEGTIQSNFFNKKEQIHLVEVRELFAISARILDIAVILSIISLFMLIITIRRITSTLSEKQAKGFFKGILTRLLIWTGSLVNSIAVFFAIVALTFDSSFFKFHELFFRTDTWLLNPATDNLIRLFPQAFFFDIFVRIIVLSVISATILLITGVAIKKITSSTP